ncbi:hypothetical protein LCGC14_1127420 [marine sediment metagenome]|uniref:HNH nuclease domain-containing protein n=1 Tax=marine sediment metagenome TaxID=412755 RepID=A0A0F9PK94_9ZZZZ
MQSKLSRHQKAILQILAEEIKDEFWGIPITMLSRIAAKRLEKVPGSYVENRLEWRKRRRSPRLCPRGIWPQAPPPTEIEFNGNAYFRLPNSEYRSHRVYYRTHESNRTYLHRDIWEYHHGPIPIDHCVHHIDGNSFNNAIENLTIMKHGEHSNLHFSEWYAKNNPRKLAEVLTEKWRATFSRCLKRLEARGLIERISWIRTEQREGKSYHVQYVGGRTHRIVLTPEGRELTEALKTSFKTPSLKSTTPQ